MSQSRDAVDTITGYFYQFDYCILQILCQEDPTAVVCIEGVEDVDVNSAGEDTAIQCKYYAKTEYNHSVIAKPIRLMLVHYAGLDPAQRILNYMIYSKYSSGQDKFPGEISVDFAKRHFLSYTQNGVKHELHKELDMRDSDILDFLNHLKVNINALSFEDQWNQIIVKIRSIFRCEEYEADHYYYNNALKIIKTMSTQQEPTRRSITKSNFINMINQTDALYSIWYVRRKGISRYCNEIRSKHFSHINVSPYERMFLIECDGVIDNPDLKTLILKISRNWSRLSRREVNPFCPYIYIHNISGARLSEIKRMLVSDGIVICDGYDYFGADFRQESICRKATNANGIILKIINKIEFIDRIAQEITAVRELYQFYLDDPYYENSGHKHLKIRVLATKDVESII